MPSTNPLVAAVLLLLVGCAAPTPVMKDGGDHPRHPIPDHALVWFLRPASLEARPDYAIWDGDRLIGLSRSRTGIAYLCPPGHRMFVATNGRSAGCSADLREGQTYYVMVETRRHGAKLSPVEPDTEEWRKAPTWMREFTFRIPIPSGLAERQADMKEKITGILEFLRTDEGRKDVTRIRPEYGR